MSTWVGIDAWEDEEARREDDWQDAWDQLDSEHEPPEECPCCRSEMPGACCVCSMLPAARPEGGERDG